MAANPPRQVTRDRERRAWELRVTQFQTEQQIADALGIDTSTVCRMLQRLEKRLAKTFEGQAAEIKAEQTAQLQHIAQEAIRAWERSQQDAEIERTVSGPQGATTTTERRGQVGDSRFLDQVRGALEDIRDIWGLDAPKRTDVTSDGQPIKALIGIELDKI